MIQQDKVLVDWRTFVLEKHYNQRGKQGRNEVFPKWDTAITETQET